MNFYPIYRYKHRWEGEGFRNLFTKGFNFRQYWHLIQFFQEALEDELNYSHIKEPERIYIDTCLAHTHLSR